MTHQETRAAVDALAHSLRNRDPDTDDEMFALEFITALRARGWRPTEARPQQPWQRPRPAPEPGAAERGAAKARELLAQRDAAGRVSCRECGAPAVWAWQPPAASSPVHLCDDHAASVDLGELTELFGRGIAGGAA